MRPVDTAAQAIRAARGGQGTRLLAWIEAKNRTSNAIEAMGLWTGDEDRAFAVVDAWTGSTVSRTFQGAGGLLGVGAIRHEAGLQVRPVTVSLSGISADVMTAVRLYDVRGARVQIWEVTLSPLTGQMAGNPELRYKGFVNKAPLPRPVAGGDAILELALVSTARLLSIPYPRRKSDTEQQRRIPAGGGVTDRIRRYSAKARTLDVPWGQKDTRK